MYGKKVRLRIVFIISILTIIILSVYIVLKLLEDDVVYFKSPTEIKQSSENMIIGTLIAPIIEIYDEIVIALFFSKIFNCKTLNNCISQQNGLHLFNCTLF